MEKKIFFSDLDGTLLNDKKEITPRTRKALDEWLSRGNVLALSSGRPLNSVLDVIRQHRLVHENLYAISYNGSLIYHCMTGNKITNKTLSLEQVAAISKIARDEQVFCQAYDDDSILIPYEGEEILYYTKTVRLPYHILPEFPKGIQEPPCKLLCIDLSKSGKLETLANKLMQALPGELSCVCSTPVLLEIFSASSGKGNAVADLCHYLQVPIENTYAAGDEQNDISMLQAVTHSIAMQNGRDIVKACAKHVTTEDNNNDGLLPFFQP